VKTVHSLVRGRPGEVEIVTKQLMRKIGGPSGKHSITVGDVTQIRLEKGRQGGGQ